MKRITEISILIFVIVFSACDSPKEKALKHIRSMESNDSVFSNNLMTELKTAYVDFANDYPDDESTSEFLFKGAQRAVVLQQPNEAVELLQKLNNNYPNSAFNEDALFLLAFTCENNLHDLPRAKLAYEDFLKKYPNGELAEDAHFALQNLGKSPEEILKSLPTH